MNFIPVKVPSVVKRIFPNYVWDIQSEEKVIYLTFDDGPTPTITDWTLNILKNYNAKATFFCIGSNIEKHPELFKKIQSEGHAFGNHTFNHPNGWNTKTDVYLNEVLETQTSIETNLQNPDLEHSQLFRPPYGKITNQQGKSLRQLGYKIIMWDVIAFDWTDSISKEKCYQNVVTKTTSGSIVVFHDSVKASRNMQYALPKILDYFSEKGFEFKRIP